MKADQAIRRIRQARDVKICIAVPVPDIEQYRTTTVKVTVSKGEAVYFVKRCNHLDITLDRSTFGLLIISVERPSRDRYGNPVYMQEEAGTDA